MTEKYIFYLFYSFIQGVTEFLPISSSGHLNILEILYNGADKRNLYYETTAHIGSLIALCLYLYSNGYFKLSNVKLNFFPICIATVPAILVGLILKFFDHSGVNLKIIGLSSILGALLLYFAEASSFKLIIKNRIYKFLLAGIFQCLAFIPGFSRSGACITAFLLFNENRRDASILSLYLGLPIISISFLGNVIDIDEFYLDFSVILIFFASFVFALITIIFFIKLINNISFKPFIIYRLLLGIIILTFFG